MKYKPKYPFCTYSNWTFKEINTQNETLHSKFVRLINIQKLH